jgi:hypothetical protein
LAAVAEVIEKVDGFEMGIPTSVLYSSSSDQRTYKFEGPVDSVELVMPEERI